jgi:hypothetical protein
MVLGVAVVAGALAACSSGGSDAHRGTPPIAVPVAIVIKDSTGLGGPMTMTVSPDTVAHGAVTFTVRNAGTMRHQLVVVRTSAGVLTSGASQRVSERGAVGAIRVLRPGVTKSLTV